MPFSLRTVQDQHGVSPVDRGSEPVPVQSWIQKARGWFRRKSKNRLQSRLHVVKPSRSHRRTRIEALEERVLLSNDVVVGFGDVYGVRSRIDVDQVDNYTQEDGGTLEIEINSTTSFDRVQIAGQATLDGRLKVLVDPSYQPAEGD
ncbi:MAG: LEPR-XLL domain-containing protein, partial [Planctomycetota bacterium]